MSARAATLVPVTAPLRTDPELLTAIARGDRGALEALYHRHARWLLVRLHHRCAVYDLLNNYGANGEDFLSFGYRVRF